jgi:hypothetical protein
LASSEKNTNAAASELINNNSGAVKETLHEYFSEIEKEIKKESKGSVKEIPRQNSNSDEYEKISCKVILLVHLPYPALMIENTDTLEVQ